jgi:hypothetical protein
MNKKLPTKDIANELAGSSVFFQPQAPSKSAPKSPEVDNKPTPAAQTDEMSPSLHPSPNKSSGQDIMTPRHRDTTTASHLDRQQPLNEDSVMVEHFDEIRKAVRQLGKEVSTHRFTAEEKAALADIVYTCTRQGVRTSENEITRVGVNWLLLDYQQNGANSVLARLLERLHS